MREHYKLDESLPAFIIRHIRIFSIFNLTQFTILLVLPLVGAISLAISPINKAHALQNSYVSQADTFVTPSTTWSGNGTSRNGMPIGSYTDYTIGGVLFSQSKTLINFGQISLPPGAIVQSAYVRVYHYGTNAGDDTVYVARVTSGWNEGTVWGGPSFTGNYGSYNFPSYNSDFVAAARDIPVNTALVNELRSPNNGIMIKNLNNDFSPGVVVCQRNMLVGPCAGAGVGGDGNKAPRLIVNYIVNTPPNQPNLDRPQNGWELGPRTNGMFTNVTCDTTGTGAGCDVEFRASADDPDNTFPISNTYEINSTQGGSANHTNGVEGWQTWTRALSDGNWRWRGKSTDVHGGDSGWTGYRNFIVDTTAPAVPVMTAEPEFTPGVQNTVTSSVAADNIIGGVQYEFERSTDPVFTTPVSSGWVDSNSFTFASLVDEQIYYYRVRSRDSLHNVSAWSSEVSSTQDATLPVIDTLTVSELRFSPLNGDGVKDATTIDVDYSDLHLDAFRIDVEDASGAVVRSFSESGLNVTSNSSSFDWDGKDSGGNFVADGSYNIKVYVSDKAGNEVLNDTNWVIIDNMPADVSIQPADGSWLNSDSLDINGQTEADATLVITNLTTSQVKNAVLNGVGQYLENFSLNLGENVFEFIVKDSVENTNTENATYYREESAPTINNISPDSLINDRTPAITFDINDTGDGAYISGVDASSIYLSITHPDNGELVLVNNGVNIQPALGSISENCSTQNGTYGSSKAENCTFTYTFTGELQPDGDYQIKADVSDIAGNSGLEAYGGFELDSHIQNDITTPTNNQLFNYSKVALSGTAEKGATLNITIPDVDAIAGADSESFVVDSASTSGRVTVNNCRASSSPSQDGVKEICDWQVTDFQLERDLINNAALQNAITFALTDPAGNTNSKIVNVDVNLYAVSLNINTDIEFFSPNGDGRQDGVEFKDMSTSGQVDSWEIRVDIAGNRVKTFSGVSSLPGNMPWDGRDDGGNYVPDGEYTYYLWLKTTDGIEFTTTPSTLTAVTTIQNGVVITYPRNDSFTTRGVVNVQGQAPVGTKVRVCDDVIGIDQPCNFDYSEIEVDANGSFSVIIPLYRLAGFDVTEHFLSATAYDKYGNVTAPSNNVKVTVTNQTPFERVEIIPVLTGVNNASDYQVIVDKLNNNQPITQADIDSLRSVVFRSVVNQGTERVKIGFADHTNLDELPDSVSFQNIGWIDGNDQTHLYESFTDGSTPYVSCNTTDCTWDFYYPVPPVNGGLYEISFNGKLAEDVQTLTAALSIDGNIPAAPMILDIDKKESGAFLNTNLFENKHYSNSETVLIKGVSDPGADIEVRNSADGQAICTTQANSIGFWNCEVDLSVFYPGVDTAAVEFTLEVSATLGANTVDSLETKSLVIDKIAPVFNSVTTSNEWHQSGDIADVSLVANERLSHAIAVEGSSLNCINDTVAAGAVHDLNLSSDRLQSTGSFIVDGNAVEGRYCMNLQIVDLAGNKAIQDKEYYIDNTAPDVPGIDTSTWGIYNGVNTQPGYVAKGRLNPEYVHEEDKVAIVGFSEASQKVELWVDGAKVQEVFAYASTSGLCAGSATGDVVSDQVLVKSGYSCLYAFEYTFDKGEKGYLFQVKSIDFAGNESGISEDELIYYDKTPPLTPETVKVTANGKDIVDWQYAKNQDVLADKLGTGNFGKLPITNQKNINIEDWGEPLSDAIYTNFDPTGQVMGQNIIQKSGNGIDNRAASLAKGDGVYTYHVTTYDAPGNKSADHLFQIELDTVPPRAPGVSLSQNFSAIFMSVIGEPGSFADGAVNSQLSRGGTTSGTVKSLSIYRDSDWERTYTFCVRLKDRATNLSGYSCKSITTPVRPTRPGECNLTQSQIDKYKDIATGDITYPEGKEINIFEEVGFSKSCRVYEADKLKQALEGLQDDIKKQQEEAFSCFEKGMAVEGADRNQVMADCKFNEKLGTNTTKGMKQDMENRDKANECVQNKMQNDGKSAHEAFWDCAWMFKEEERDATYNQYVGNECIMNKVSEGKKSGEAFDSCADKFKFSSDVNIGEVKGAYQENFKVHDKEITEYENMSGLEKFGKGLWDGIKSVGEGLWSLGKMAVNFVVDTVKAGISLAANASSAITALAQTALGGGSFSDNFNQNKQILQDAGVPVNNPMDDLAQLGKAVAAVAVIAAVVGLTIVTGGLGTAALASALGGGMLATAAAAGIVALGTTVVLNTGIAGVQTALSGDISLENFGNNVQSSFCGDIPGEPSAGDLVATCTGYTLGNTFTGEAIGLGMTGVISKASKLSLFGKVADDVADAAKVTDNLTKASKAADDIADASKIADNVAGVADDISEVGKYADDLSDASNKVDNFADNLDDASKASDNIATKIDDMDEYFGPPMTMDEHLKNLDELDEYYSKPIAAEGFGNLPGDVVPDNPYFVRLKPGTTEPIAIDTAGFKGGKVTPNGGIREPKQFWNAWNDQYGSTLSDANKSLIADGASPVVDDQWIKNFPEHKPYKGQTIEHHHLNQANLAYPLPEELHRLAGNYKIWH